MKEFIEIPFGAKDSELGGWEYNIPEGYTASIENGMIIVKKEESEDERIRKYLLKLAERCPEDSIDFMGEVKKEDVIAWLEKQGWQNHAWSGWNERMRNASIRACQYMVEHFENSTLDYEDAIDWLKSLKERFNLQPKQEWSEEDKGNLLDVKCIIDKVWHSKDFREDTYYSAEELESLWSWLDDIWQRLEYHQNTWKSTWSEEDENRFNNLVWLVERSNEGKATKEGFIKFINSLKTLKDRVQPQWRPSEEQLNALDEVYKTHGANGTCRRVIFNLLEQLKKLCYGIPQ